MSQEHDKSKAKRECINDKARKNKGKFGKIKLLVNVKWRQSTFL